ncbi:hypothetical protein ACFQYP_30105 [Nonomuraea antimicrobica]
MTWGRLSSSAPNRKTVIQLGAAGVAIAVVTVGMVLLTGTRDEQTPVPTPAPTSAVPLPATLPPISTAEPTPDVLTSVEPSGDPTALIGTVAPKATLGQAVPRGGYGEWLKAFDDALTAQQAMGGISPDVAGKARDKLRKVARKFAEGKADSTLGDIAGVYRDLARAQEKGEMNASGPASEFLRDWRLPDGDRRDDRRGAGDDDEDDD